ncbi:hypothetical protein FPQ18DRAFT_375752 [Pyronema domesticum]|nr:hypothetical protein FPQ18DRAFT_375752 [Pyronema domesticum]
MSIIRTRNSGLGMRNGAFLKNELELLSLQNPHKKQSSITVNEIHQDGASFGTQRLAYKFWHWPSDQYITCSRWGSGLTPDEPSEYDKEESEYQEDDEEDEEDEKVEKMTLLERLLRIMCHFRGRSYRYLT